MIRSFKDISRRNISRGCPLQHALIVLLLVGTPSTLVAQSEMGCGAAVSQLQGYVQQVNGVAHFEYTQGIPARCGPNGYCANALLQQLSAWYAQQSMLVNQWYATIARQCSSTSVDRPVSRKREVDPTREIEDVDDLEVDDEDKTVRIRIPSKPSGFRSRSR